MKKKYIIGLSLTLVLWTAGCSSAQLNEGNPAKSSTVGTEIAAVSTSSASSTAVIEDKTIEVKALHLKIRIPADWTLQRGEESFSFQKDGAPVGGLDGLGYTESNAIDSLLPNGATVNKQEALEDFPVPTVRAELVLEDEGEGGQRNEVHYYFFLKDAKAIYDLRFDAKRVMAEQSEEIARTVEAG